MIANALRVEIERYASEMRRSNPLFLMAKRGELGGGQIAAYLTNIRYLICHTPIYLARARDRARAVHDEKLAVHYEHKFAEEAGHEAWAESDLKQISGRSSPPQIEATNAICELVAFLAKTIDADPTLYLSYILFVEYLTVIAGPEWLQLLEERCAIPRATMTVVGNHIELDKNHVEEALESIDDLVGDPRKLGPMRQVLLDSMTYFDGFCAEVASTEYGKHARASDSSAA